MPMPRSTTSSFNTPSARYSFTPRNFSSTEYFSALLTRLTGERHCLADVVISQHQAADQQHGTNPEDEETALNPAPAERLHAGALVLDAQRQSAENIVEVARNLGFPFRPPGRSGENLVTIPTLVVCGIDHHGKLISASLGQLVGDQLLEHFRKEGLFQVIGIEADPAQHRPVLGELR